MNALADKETRGIYAAIAEIGDASVPLLVEALTSENEHLQICALGSLEIMGDKARDAIPALTRFLEIKDRSMWCWRDMAVRLLGKIGPPAKPAVPALWAVHGNPYTPEERAQVVLALWRIDKEAVDAVGLLTEMLALDRIPTKTAGARALGEMGPGAAPAVPVLIGLLEEYLAEHARASARSRGDPLAPSGCGYSPLAPPTAAAIALGLIGDAARAALPAIREFLGSSPDWSKPAILLSLWRIEPGSAEAVPALMALLRSVKGTNSTTAEAAARALGEIGPEARSAVPDLIAALEQHYYGGLREAAVFALGRIGEDASGAVPALKISAMDSQMCLLSVEALAGIGPAAKSALPELTELATRGPGREIREASARALRAVSAPSD
ncbi:MAG: HEAT repeat domain-containing protein [Planctomycetota bacterium]|jgi:HEAT repeat protein